MAEKLTLADAARMDCNYLTPAQAAQLIDCNPYYLTLAGRNPQERERLGFPIISIGRRTKIPRIPLLRKLGWEGEINGAT